MDKPLVIIAGPTACGKTATSIELAKKINGEIISADSMQVYKYMDIGTAKATKQEMQDIPHYLIDEFYPDEEFNVMIFQKKAKDYIDQIYKKGKIPILVGGTGFYINALVFDNNFVEEESDSNLRNELYELAEKNGVEYLHNMLKECDPESAEKIHYNNVKRVARAIEFYKKTGKPISEHNKEAKSKSSPYKTAFIVLDMDRQKLYERINKRVDVMIEDGLVDEVKMLLEKGYKKELVSMQGLGYKEIVAYINGETSLEEAIEKLKQSTRHFAKRQLTWFRGQTDGLWIDISDGDVDNAVNKIIDYMEKIDLKFEG